MSIIDRLKEQSRQRRRDAVAGEPLEPSPPAGPPAPSDDGPPDRPDAARSPQDVARYCAFWIERLETAMVLPPDDARAAVREALRAAPPRHRPPEGDARLFAAAGGTALSYGDVVAWLKVRAAEPAAEKRIDPAVARFWLDRLGPPPAPGGDLAAWSSLCGATAREAARAGCGLTAAAAFAACPDAARGYLNCASHPVHPPAGPPAAPFRKPDARRGVPEPGADEPAPLPDNGPKLGAGWPSAGPAPAPAAFAANAAGSRFGLALGGLVGALAGGAVGGFRTGLSSAFKPAPAAPPPVSTRPRAPSGNPELGRAREDAERALADFAETARQLDDHPHLASFWREVDRQAERRFGGARDGVLQEMAGQRLHPLRMLFERHARNDPDVALHHQRALAAFERLKTCWDACAQAHRDRGECWAPAPEQTAALRAACRRTPASAGQPALVEQAERLLRALAQAVKQAFGRPAAPVPNGARPPAP